MNRRDFLKHTALAAASFSALPGATLPFDKKLERTGAAKRIVIIGAGLAGLSAGYELMQAGQDVTILEAQTRPGGRVCTLRGPFAEGLYADAGATRVPDHHHFTLKYVKLFGLILDPFEPHDRAAIYYVLGQRMRVTAGQKVEWPYELTTQDRALGLAGMRQKHIGSMLGELGDVTDPKWPPPELLERYDEVNRSDLWRSRGASSEAIALLSLGGIDDSVETWSSLFMLRNQALNQKRTRYYKIRGGTDLLPLAFASRLTEQIHYSAPVVRIEQSAQGVKAIFLRGGSHHEMTGDLLICAVPFSVQKNIAVVPPFSVEN